LGGLVVLLIIPTFLSGLFEEGCKIIYFESESPDDEKVLILKNVFL
jgi:hypothetical protein